MASHRTPSTGTLERFCEFFSCIQLEYCLREPLSKFEGLSTFYCNFINVNILYCIYGTYRPFLLYVLPSICVKTIITSLNCSSTMHYNIILFSHHYKVHIHSRFSKIILMDIYPYIVWIDRCIYMIWHKAISKQSCLDECWG